MVRDSFSKSCKAGCGNITVSMSVSPKTGHPSISILGPKTGSCQAAVYSAVQDLCNLALSGAGAENAIDMLEKVVSRLKGHSCVHQTSKTENSIKTLSCIDAIGQLLGHIISDVNVKNVLKEIASSGEKK